MCSSDLFRVVCSTDNKSTIDSCGVVAMVISETELDTSKFVVSNLKVMESDITNFFRYSSIPSILPTCQIIEVGSDGRVLPPWIRRIIWIISDGFAWILPWNHIMEDTEAISATRVSRIVSKLTNSFVLWANICIRMWSNGMFLKIIPVAVAIRATTMVVDEVVVWIGDPEASWGLISVEQAVGSTSIDDQIVLDQVLGLNSILDEDGVTHGLISNIA